MAGARGTVTVVSGAPSSYLVADGDNLSSIAARFGITLNDLMFLNPMDSMPLWAGQHLNLSKGLRGAGSVAPPCVGQC
jgi:LysM repeat protein